ncbi:MAG: SulP family inorganic anion transporter [Solirubrobacteraceae bacterium]|nr:SulP family inorganic anion transporter [Solirubrobacteraceae bacterium]
MPPTSASPRRRLPSFTLPSGRVLRIELLAGAVVALALIPEAISFSIIAGVDPKVGLYASFTMAVAISIVGGRPAMISAATGAMALVVVPLVADHGVEYLFAAAILAGAIQIALGALGIAKLMRFVPQAVMTGFVNALAILIFLSQVDHLTGDGTLGYVLVAAGLAIILILPRFVPQIPSPLVAIAILTIIVVAGGIDITNVGDEGELPSTIPLLGIPSVPFSFETFTIILPFSATLAAVGLLESLMTARLVDDITDTPSDKGRESRGQGIANVITGFFGGMPGCAMIGQTMINVRVSGARTRLSTFSAGVILLVMVVGFGGVVSVIPMTALVAVMIFVAYATFDWHSIKPATLKKMPRGETAVMVLTVIPTVATDNLAIGVGVGVLASMAIFARRVAHLLNVERTVSPDGTSVIYSVRGELFFASNDELVSAFHHPDDPKHILIDMSQAHVWDASAVSALDALTVKYESQGKTVEITGLNEASGEIRDALSGQLVASH